MSNLTEIERLVDTFYRDIGLAIEIETSNPEDTLEIKAACVGFCYNSTSQDWAREHFEFVDGRLRRSYQEEDLTEYGAHGGNIRLFFALATGYLLGLYQQEKLSNDEFHEAELQIPGIIMLHLRELTDRPIQD